MKKSICFSVLCMLFTVQLWAYDVESNGLYFDKITTVSPNEMEVTYKSLRVQTNPGSITTGRTYSYYNEGWDITTADIPRIVSSCKVTTIGSHAFQSCTSLTKVVMPYYLKKVNSYAFSGCSSLRQVHVTSIEKWCEIEFSGTGAQAAISGASYYPHSANPLVSAHHLYVDNAEVTNLVIPGTITSLNSYAFMGCQGLISVTLPNSVTTIGDAVFSGCTGLSSPVYNDHVFAFMPVSYSGSYSFPDGISRIAGYACTGCSTLVSVTIPQSVREIGQKAFNYCSGLESIFCDAVTPPTLGNGVFVNVDKSIPVYVPAGSVEAYQAATGWSDFTNIQPSTYTITWKNADGSTLATNTVKLGVVPVYPGVTPTKAADAQYTYSFAGWSPDIEAVTSAATYTATYSSTLNSYTVTFLDEDGTQLSQQTVEYGSAATAPEVVVPECHHLTWDKDFGNITGDLNVNAVRSADIIASGTCGADGNNLTWALTCDSVLTISGTGAMASYANIGQSWRNYMKSFKSVVIGHGVTSIGDSAFYNCSRLTSIEISSSVTSIGRMALYKCSSMTSVTIPNSVISIGVGVFCGCIGLTTMTVEAGNTVYDSRNNCNAIIETASNMLLAGCQNTVIPSSVTSIGKNAFWECSSLTSIEIPNSVISIGRGAFYKCNSLTSVAMGNSVTSIAEGAFQDCRSLTTMDISNSVASIGRQAFANCTGLISVDIPNSVTSMGLGAFGNCIGLTSIDIPNSITSIEDSTFYHCTGLTTVTIPSSVTSIGRMALYNCSSLVSVTIPSSVTIIGPYAFLSCSSLTAMTVEAGNPVYDSRENCNAIIETATNTLIAGCQNTVIPNSVTSIWKNAFRACSGLTSVTIPNRVTSIERGAFYNCSGLTSVVIGNSVTSIGVGAFMECRVMTSVTISGSVTSIADSAFWRCRSLNSITCKAENTPELGRNVFYNVDKSIPLYVPAESVEAYKAADQWNEFTNIQPITEVQTAPVSWNISPTSNPESNRNDCNLYVTLARVAHEGDTIVLADGTYIETISLPVTYNVIIRAAQGAHPVVQHSGYFQLHATARFEGIQFEFVGQEANGYCMYFYENSHNSLYLENCEFSGYGQYCIGGWADYHIDSCIVNNCYFHDCAKSPIYFKASAREDLTNSCDYLRVTNSTFANITTSGTAVIDNRNNNGSGWVGANNTMVVDHCTFYNCKGYERMIQSYKSPFASVTNCIMMNPLADNETASVYATYLYGGEIHHNLNYGTRQQYGSGVTVTDSLCRDPQFVDAANGDYTLGEGSPAIGAGTNGSNLGDPRWLESGEDQPTTPTEHIININPSSSDALRLALASAADGDVIVMAAGTYVESNANYISFAGKHVTVRAAEDAEVIIQPQVLIQVTEGGTAHFEGVAFDASHLNDLANWYEHLIVAADQTQNRIILEGCEFYGFNINKSMIFCSGTNMLESITINNCYFHDITKSVLFIESASGTDVAITNSTFANISTDASAYYAGVIDSRATAGSFEVDHCTFYNVQAMNTDYAAIGRVKTPGAVVANSLFVMPQSTSALRAIRDVAEAINCLTYNYVYDSGWGIHSGVAKTNCINDQDPKFRVTANGDFTFAAGSPALTAATDGGAIGDPRWIPVFVPTHTYTVAGGLTDIFAASWTPTVEANDMTLQSDGTYKWEKNDLTLTVGTIEFKVCQDHSWDVCYPGGPNYQLAITTAGVYTITITFNPESGEIGATAELEEVIDTHPQTVAPTPTYPAAQVMALYSDSYTPTASWDYNANWSQTTTMQENVIDGDHYLCYSNFNYQGWHTGQPYNVKGMQYVHLDLWAVNAGSVRFYLIYGGDGLVTHDSDGMLLTLTGGRWNSFDIPLTDFEGLDLSSIFQIKFDLGTMTEFCVDNVYFYRTSATCNFEGTHSYSIVGGFTNNWSLSDAITFEDVDGVLTANVSEIEGMFKVIRDKDTDEWAYQWGCDLSKNPVIAGTPYTMSNTSSTGGEPGNLSFSNPFAGYRNAVLTLTENASCDLMLTLVSGELYYSTNDWYLAGAVNDWTIGDDYKFAPLNGSDTLVLDVTNMTGGFKIVYGNWNVEFGANKQYDSWTHGTEYVMTYPCAEGLYAASDRIYDQATITLLPDYANASVKMWITCKQNVTISAQHGSVNSIGGLYPIGSQLQLTATPEDGYSFSYWSDFSTENPHTITVSESLSSFEAICVPIDSVVYLLCLAKEGERSVYFIKPDSWQGDNVHCYMWDNANPSNVTELTASWPGDKATAFTERLYKYLIPDEFGATTDTWYIIWNNGSSDQQSEDHKYVNNAVFSIENDVTYGHGNITTINYVCTNVCDVVNAEVYDTLCTGRRYYLDNTVQWEPGDYQSRRTYISPLGGDSVVAYYLHVTDCGYEPVSFDLQFQSGGAEYDEGYSYTKDVNSVFTTGTASNASAIYEVSNAFPARVENGVEFGAKFGAGSGGGSMKFALTNPVVADSILFRVAKYGSDDITYFLFNHTQVGLPTSKYTFETFRLDSVGWIDTITIASVDAGYKRFFIQGMTIYGKTPSKVRTEQATICEGDSYDFYGKQCTQAGQYSHAFNMDGTDSLVMLRLNVIPSIRVVTDVDTINSMQQYSWHGRTWVYPDWTGYRSFYDTVTSAVTGCDSINELQLYVTYQSKPDLTMSLERNTVTESDSTTLTIRSAFALPVDETINLGVNNGSSYIDQYPSSVVLPAGETEVSVTVKTKDNDYISDIRTATLRAYGDRFNNTAYADLNMIDNDTPEISLSLSVSEVEEGSCVNCITATVRRLTHPEQDITIRFSDNSDGRISYPSSSLRMQPNVTELTATLGVNDNAYCDGTQVVDIVAYVNNAYLPCAYDTAQLTIIDNDVPTLSLICSTTMLLEGKSEAGVLTVSRNTPTDTALVVNLSVDNADGLTFPATLTIPAWQSQAQTTVAVARNGVNDDSHQITFTAASEGFASSDCYVMIIDQTLPDATIANFTASPTTAEVGSSVNVQITVLNQGAAGLAKGVTTSLYFAGSRVARFALENTLPVGESVTFNTDITLPEKVGTYELYAIVNEDRQVKEILHDNNRTYTWYIHTTPSFEVQSLTASKTECLPGDSVILTGQLSGSRAANAEVEVYSVNNGYRRSFKVQADGNGSFTAVFKPQEGQSGHFALGACYPSERSYTEMVGVDYYGMEIPVGNLTCMVNTGYDYESRISVRNTGSLTLHNIHAEATNVPEGCHINFYDISELRGGNYGYIYFTLHSDNSTPGNDWQTVNVHLTTDEGLQGDKTVYYFSRDPRGQLVSSVSSITASVSVQRPMEYVFMLQSTGLGETGEITLSLPDWIQTVTPQTIPSIASGEYAEVILRINTSSFANKLNLPITGDIGISAENCSGMTLPFTITPVSDIRGTLHVDVCDENTYYAEGFPHVAGAQVLVKNTSTHQVIAQGLTNAAGIYEIELPEGYYTVSVTADNHDSYTNNILLLPEQTTSLTVNLSIRAITVTWTVEETEVEDQYEVVTNVTYETHVPKPVVVVSAPARIAADELAEGESLIYNVTAINQGLIRAEDVTISLPSGGDMFRFEALAYSAPFNMEAKQQVVIPVKVTRLEQPESAPARGPHAMLECQDNMLTLYYWDCGTDRKWHQYATPLIYMDCDDPPTVPTPEPDRDDDPRDPMVIGPGIPYPWPPTGDGRIIVCEGCGTYREPDEPGTYADDRGCEPCQNQFLLNVGKLGLDVASLAADFLPQVRLLALAKNTKVLLNLASEAVNCYNNARQAYAEEHTIEAALVGCVTHGEETSWEDLLDELQEELSNLGDAIQERIENPDAHDDPDDHSDDIYDDAMDVIDDLIAFTRPCEHTAENAAYAPMRTSEEATDIYAGEPEHLARFKSRIHVALEEIEALENYKKLYVNADVQQYCSNVEIEELMNTWQTMLQSSLTDEQLNSVRPAALPDEQWQNLVERMHNTHDAVRGIQPANDNYVSTDSINYYTDKIAACEAQAQAWGYTSSSQMFGKELNLLLGQVDEKSNSVCASISLQFKQTMTLTRQAFRGTLSVFNGHETQAMTNIHLNLEVRSADNGQLATSHDFQIDLENLSDISGEEELVTTDGWTIAANTTGTATILFIPTVYAAPQSDRVWSFGGTLTYTDPFSGLTVTRDLYPVQLTVRPTPLLEMTYFMQRDVYSDDPLTDEIEESEPAEFALLINNIGYGEAKNMNMTTNAPEIVANEKGLLIEFNMIRSVLNGKQVSLPIGGVTTTQFGTIPAGSQMYAQWFFESTLLGHFNHYDVTATHVTSYNNPDLSLIDTVTIHEMIHSIGVPASGSSQIGWLVNDEADNNDLPDKLYVSDGRVETLYSAQQPNISKQDENTYILTLTPSMAGWNYGWCLDPTRGLQTLQSIMRLSDNAAIDMRNVWQTPCVMRDQADPVHEHRLHVADSIGVETSYRLVFSEPINVVVSDAKDASELSLGAKAELTVTPTGHLTVDQPSAVRSLTMQYSELGHAQITGITDLTAATVEMTLQLPTLVGGVAGHWFAFGVPFEVNIERGIRIDGADAPARYGYDYILDEYDGALRAATQDGWKRVPASADLLPGKLYMIYSAGETAWRFTAAHPAALTEEQSVDVQAYVSSLNNRHSGWNGVANTLWSKAAAALDGVDYATAYDNQFCVYQVVRADEHAFAAAAPFFVQAVADDMLSFAASGATSAPWRVTPTEMPVMTVTLTNEAQTFTDKAYLSVVDDKQNGFLIGHDLEKMQVAAPAVPQLWVEAYNMHLAAHEMPFDSYERVVPIGLYAPAEGEYTLAVDNVPNEYVITLLKSGQAVWTISEDAYVAALKEGNNTDYALRIIQKNDVVTGVDALNGGNDEVRKMIIDDQLYILGGDKTYTVQGQEVR